MVHRPQLRRVRHCLIFFMITFAAAAISLYGQEGYPSIPKMNDFRAYDVAWSPFTYFRQESANMYGGEFSVAVHANRYFAMVGDLGAQIKTEDGATLTVATYRFGPRFSVRQGDRVTMFSHALVGGAQAFASSGLFTFTAGGPSIAIGSGFDYALTDWFAVRVVQADYTLVSVKDVGISRGLRIGTSFVFRFGS